MLRVREALEQVLARVAGPAAPETIDVAAALGRVLAEEVVSDADSPPFDASAMDGFALRSRDTLEAPVVLRIVGERTAGASGEAFVEPGCALAIMTGAAIPGGADAVVPVESTERVERETGLAVRILAPAPSGHCIRRCGENLKRGEVAVERGLPLRPIDLAVLVACGRGSVSVHRRPRCAVIATGDELVTPGAPTGPGRVRNSNGPMLAALVHEAGGAVTSVAQAGDAFEDLRERILAGLGGCDVLVVSGGVSMGTRDRVVRVLVEAGVEPVFHRVAMRPGKPLFFGVFGTTLVFGLPGNPVSSYLDFVLFVEAALGSLAGRSDPSRPWTRARAAGEMPRVPGLEAFVPVALAMRDGQPWAEPVRYRSSGDLHGARRADGMAVLAPGDGVVPRGEFVDVLPLRWR